MTDDLIARLRDVDELYETLSMAEIADVLEAQARRIAELSELYAKVGHKSLVLSEIVSEKTARIAELEEENAQFREALAKGFEEFAPDTTWRSCDLAYMIRNFDVWNIERNRRAARDALGEKND